MIFRQNVKGHAPAGSANTERGNHTNNPPENDSERDAGCVRRLVVPLLGLTSLLYVAFFAFVPTQVGSQIQETLLSLWETGPNLVVGLYLVAMIVLSLDLLLIGLAAFGIHIQFVDVRSEKSHSKNDKQP